MMATRTTGRLTRAQSPLGLPSAAGNGGQGVTRMEHGGIRGDHANEAPYTAALHKGVYSLAIHPRQHPSQLLDRQHHRQTLRPFRECDVVHPSQVNAQHLLEEEQQGAQRLVLGGRRNLARHRKMAQELFHLRRTHVLRLSLMVEQNEALDPVQIRLLGAKAVMTQPNSVPHLFQQAGGRRRGGVGRTLGHWRVRVRHGHNDLGNSAKQFPSLLTRRQY